MSRDLELVPVEDEQTWNLLLESSPDATAFHDWKWLSTLSELLSLEFVPMQATLHGRPFAAVPLVVKRRGPVRTVNWVPFPYVGPVVGGDRVEQCLHAMAAWQTRHLVALHQASFAPGFEPNADAFAGTGFRPERDETLVVRAESEAAAWSKISGSARNKVNRSARMGVTIGPMTGAGARRVSTFVADAFARRQLPSPYPSAAGSAVWDAYHDDPGARLAEATLDGEVVGAAVTVTRASKAYLWFAGTDERGRSSGAGVALYWDAIRWSVDRGAELDLVGVPDEGIRRYKEQFGSVAVPFVVARSTPLPGYQRLQRFSTHLRRLATSGSR